MWAIVVPRKAWFVKTPTSFFQTNEEAIPYLVGEEGSVAYGKWMLRFGKSVLEPNSEKEAKDQGRVLALTGQKVELLQRVISGNVDIYYLIGDIMAVTEETYLNKLLREVELLGDEQGFAIEKAGDVMTPEGFISYTKDILEEWDDLLLPQVDIETVNHFHEFLGKHNWEKLSDNTKDGLFTEAGIFIPPELIKAMPELKEITNTEVVSIAQSARKHMSSKESIAISTSLSVQDTQAIKNVSIFGIAYFPTSFTNQNMALAQKLQVRLEQGLKDGVPYTQVVKTLQKEMPGTVSNKRNSWMNIAAHAMVGRARSRARLQGYMEAEIAEVKVIAVLDRATTPICRFLDGQTIDVQLVAKHWEKVEKEALPIDSQFPWLNISSPRGSDNMNLTINGKTIASGPKENGGAGLSWKKGISVDGRVPAEMGMPPYHALCRSETYYDYSVVQI